MPNQVLIQAPQTTLLRGQPLSVPITIELDSPLQVRGVHGKFLGAEETSADYTTTSTDSKGHTTTQTHTAVEKVEITTQAELLAGNARMGFVGNLTDAIATLFGGGEHEVWPAGKYPFEVEVIIPAAAPPTHQGEKTRVFYELSVQVDVPAARDLKATEAFQVLPLPVPDLDSVPVRTRYPDDSGRGLIDSLLTPDVRLEMALAANVFERGDPIAGIFTIDSQHEFSCREIRVRLLGIERSEAHGHTDSYTHVGPALQVARPGSIQGHFGSEFTLTADVEAPLTARGKRFSIDWFVQVELDVPWAKDPKLRAPVTLLEKI